MKISDKISRLSASPTVSLNSKAKELKAAGKDILNFSVGEPDFPTPQAIVEKAIKALQEGKTRYGPAGGSLPFRKAISEKLHKKNHIEFPPEQIVCGIGAKELLFHAFLALLNEGDEVILLAPYWVSYKEQIKATGAIPIVIGMPEDYHKSILNIEAIKGATTAKTRGIVLCSPSNPSGAVFSKDEFKEIGAYIKEQNWWVISDEIYEYLSFDTAHLSLLEVCPELKDQFIYVNGMSKGFAMTGWRVGYMAGPTNFIAAIKKIQGHSSTCLPPFIEEAATWAIQQGSQIMTDKIAILKERRSFALQELNKIKKISYIPPKGAFYVFIDIREALKASKEFTENDSIGFCNMLLEKYFVAMVPGEAFGTPGFIRLSYAADQTIIKEGISRLKSAIESIL